MGTDLPVDPSRFAAFMVTMFVMALTPGPANLFAITTGIERGRPAVVAGVLGMNSATLVWFAASALGLGALILTFPRAFHMLALAGAAYVAWLGVQSILGALRTRTGLQRPALKPDRSALLNGFMVQIANPKAVLFFTAVLPPFVDTQRPLGWQLLVFAIGTISMDVMAMTAYGLGGAVLAERMAQPAFARAYGLVVGGLLIGAALLIGLRH